MPKRRVITTTSLEDKQTLRPAITPEGREQQLISLAMDLAEQRLLDGTASAQEVTHFLKLGSTKNKLEVEKLKKETELLETRKQSIEASARMDKMYEDAMRAMQTYKGEIAEDPNSDPEDCRR